MEEEFKVIKGYEDYKVSNMGYIISYKNKNEPRILKPRLNRRGYGQVNLLKNGKAYMVFVHRIVAEYFVPNPHNYLEVNHIDECKTNNRADNLEWCTRTYNVNYGSRNEKNKYSSSLCLSQFDLNGNWIKNIDNVSEFCRKHNYREATIIAACEGKIRQTAYKYIWRYWEPEYKEGYKLDVYGLVIGQKRPINRLNKDTREIEETFSSIRDIELKYNYNRNKIIDSCRDNTLAYDSYWEYNNAPITRQKFNINEGIDFSNIEKDLYQRPVYQLNFKTNNIINKYNSIYDAYKNKVQACQTANGWQKILACCQRIRPVAFRSNWSFVDQFDPNEPTLYQQYFNSK